VKALVIYDTRYGHTQQIAQAIGEAIGAEVLRADGVSPADLARYDLLIVGSPTHGGHPTEGIHGLLNEPLALDRVKVAAFDTRTQSIWNRILPFGYAAPRIAQSLEGSGGNLLAPPEGFVVQGIQGPLRDGELKRAAKWAKGITK
jgi:flavodoxin